ncbi:MAG: NAD(P)-dependent oxidoreductase [Gammaproteobacteria bacterium]
MSRGETYDVEALLEALKERRLAGAGLDVTDPEPLPEGHSLWKLNNVLLTPHIAGESEKVWDRQFSLLKENVERLADGLPLLNVVDKQKRY